jgi:CarboxypepD_reg-like domain
MKQFFLFILIFFGSNIYSQEIIVKGKIIDFESNKSMPYVNIGVFNKSIGTVSDKEGKFSLSLNKNLSVNDSITFSYIGFETKKYSISSLINKINEIELTPQINIIDEVVINLKKPKKKKIGSSLKGLGLTHINFYNAYEHDVDDRLSKEIGMNFKIKKDCKIERLIFNISSNHFKSLKFRVNFYKVDSGMPTELLVNKNIIFEIRDGFLGWYTVDLKPYHIFLEKDQKEIAVTIQWVESHKLNENSKFFSVSVTPSPLSTRYFREKSMDKWSKGSGSLSFYLDALCN